MMNNRQALEQLAIVNLYLSGGPPPGNDNEKQTKKTGRRKNDGDKGKQKTIRDLSPYVEAEEGIQKT